MGAVRLDDLVYDWKRALARQELAPTTIKTYGWALLGFCRFLADHGVIDTHRLRRDLVERWQDDCRERLGRRSRSTASVAVRQFLRWSVGQGKVNPRAPYWVTHVRGASGVPRPLSPEILRLVLGYLVNPDFVGSVVDLRNRALFLYILTTGARAFEVVQVKRVEVTRAIIQQKGGRDKDMDVPPIVVEALEDYLAERQDTNPFMWVTLDNNHPMRPMTPSSILEVWKRLATTVGTPPWTTHQLRHTGATELYEADIDGLVIADWLGHKGMGHVTQYTRVSRRRRRQATDVLQRLIENAEPRGRLFLMRKQGPVSRPRYEGDKRGLGDGGEAPAE